MSQTQSSGKSRIKYILVGLLFLGAGLGVFYLGYSDMQQQQEMLSNPVTIEATMEEKWIDVSEDVGTTRDRTTTNDDESYDPNVRFTYEYDGTRYNGTDIYPGDISQTYDTRNDAESVLAELPAEGQQFNASVAPSYPDQAFIRAESSSNLLVLIIGAVFAIVGVFPLKRGILGPTSETDE